MDIKKRIQTIVVPYLSFGLLVLLYWQFIERRFRDSNRSFTDSLFGLFSGCYDNLEFNVHLWFLPFFFVTVVLLNIMVNLCNRRIAYLASALMSCIYIMLPIPELLWGFNRVFKYIGFYAAGVLLAGMGVSVIKKELGVEIVAIGLLALNYFLSIYNLTAALWSNIIAYSLHPWTSISNYGENRINCAAQRNRCSKRELFTCDDDCLGYIGCL